MVNSLNRAPLNGVFLLLCVVTVAMVTLTYKWVNSALQLATAPRVKLPGEARVRSPEREHGDYSVNRDTKEEESTAPRDVRLLCIVPIANSHLQTSVQAVNSTWGPRCDKILYFKDGKEGPEDTIIHLPVPAGYTHLNVKMRAAFQYVYDNYRDQFDWILKADDDTYVLVENLKLFLSAFDPNLPFYTGRHRDAMTPGGYMGGGPGYVISRCALRQMIEVGFAGGQCRWQGRVAEDIMIGECLHVANVTLISSLDSQGKERFRPSCFTSAVRQTSIPVKGNDLSQLDMNNSCSSEYLISFHDVSPAAMLVYDQLLYRTSVHGRPRPDPFQIPRVNT